MNKEEKCAASRRGRIVISRGEETKRIYPGELSEYLENGWQKGFTESHNSNLGKAHIGKNLGNTNGFKKGCKPWNKGEKASDHPKLQVALDKAHASRTGVAPWNKGKTSDVDSRIGIIVNKAWLTKKKNGTTNTSKPEELLYEKLLKENETKTIYRNYKCDRYPYHCDFYIVEDDLFIELNAHWTHGGRPFNPEDYSCQKQLELWREKAKVSKYWASAIDTWTISDVAKAKCAKENNLNYWVIY